jgi:hypothetical protein
MENEKKAQLIKETLEAMLDQKFRYGGKIHTVKGYTILDDKEQVKIQTNYRIYEKSFESFEAFIGYMEPIEENGMQLVREQEMMLPKMQINSDVIGQLKDILLDNIDKVKKDKEFIPQATAVKLNVDSVIDLAKIEVAYMEAFVRVKKQG